MRYIFIETNIYIKKERNRERGGDCKKSLKIPKGYSESVYRRRTDNTMAKRKSKKNTNNDIQNIHIKLKIE